MTTRNPALAALDFLVGEWSMEARFEQLPAADGDARVVFEWLPGEQFLVERWSIPVPEAPDGIAIIGLDTSGEHRYLQHYFDSRGVARVYKMNIVSKYGRCGATRQTSRPLTSASATPASSLTTGGLSRAPGRFATTERRGSMTSSSRTGSCPDHAGRTPLAGRPRAIVAVILESRRVHRPAWVTRFTAWETVQGGYSTESSRTGPPHRRPVVAPAAVTQPPGRGCSSAS